MEKRTKLRLGLLLSTFVCIPSMQAILSSTNPSTTSANITSAVIDQATGDFYIGTAAPGAGVGALGANCSIGRFSIPTTATAVGTVLTGTSIQSTAATDAVIALAIARNGTTSTRLSWANSAGTTIHRVITYDSVTGLQGTQATRVLDGAGVATGLIKTLAASPLAVFGAVRSTATEWPDIANSLSVVSSWPLTGLVAADSVATAGVWAVGGGFTIGVTAAVNVRGFAIGTAITAAVATPKLVYDPVFSNLYLGNGVTQAANAGDGCRSLAIFNVNPSTSSLTPVQITSGANIAFNDFGVAGGNIIADTSAAGAARSLSVSNLGIMHTSTGLHYLIVNGGHGLAAATGNQVWALPLVSPGFTGAGTLADVTSSGFSVQSANGANLYSISSIPAIVGNAVLPWQISTIPNQMQIVGDTIYLCNNVNAAGTDEAGIMYSQAIFGAEGKIIRWTRWEKAAPAAMGTSDNAVANATDGSINFFGVDARSGRIWSVPESDGVASVGATGPRMIKLSNWADTPAVTNTTANGTLAAALALPANLPEGVWSVYNVGRSSVNFGAVTTAAYTVFGGQGKVAFARTDIKAASVLAYQITPPTDFTLAANLLTTTLPAGAGVVQALGYSHWAVGAADGFFFAGTNAGLYAYSLAAGGGFTPNLPIAALNAAPWSTAGNLWTQITNVTGAVRKIRSIGNKVYILARDNNGGVITDTLYGVAVQVTVAAINTNIQTLAVSGTGNLANATVIEDFEIVSWTSGSPTATVAAGGDLEQVVLATNDGLYQSQALLGLNAAANTTQTLALWTQVDADAAFTLLHSQNRLEAPTSFVGSYIADNSDGKGTFTKSLINQFIAQGPVVTSNPIDFTDDVITDIFPSIVTSYWSDGARRLISTAPGDGTLNLQTLPYKVDSANFNMTAPLLGLDRVNGKNVHAIAMMPNGYAVACLGPDGIAVL